MTRPFNIAWNWDQRTLLSTVIGAHALHIRILDWTTKLSLLQFKDQLYYSGEGTCDIHTRPLKEARSSSQSSRQSKWWSENKSENARVWRKERIFMDILRSARIVLYWSSPARWQRTSVFGSKGSLPTRPYFRRSNRWEYQRILRWERARFKEISSEIAQ
jgi:hypothetical protein